MQACNPQGTPCLPYPLQIDWARLEMERLHGEGETWRRVLQTKQSEAGEPGSLRVG